MRKGARIVCGRTHEEADEIQLEPALRDAAPVRTSIGNPGADRLGVLVQLVSAILERRRRVGMIEIDEREITIHHGAEVIDRKALYAVANEDPASQQRSQLGQRAPRRKPTQYGSPTTEGR